MNPDAYPDPDDMTDEQVAAMITSVRAVLVQLAEQVGQDFAAWEQECAADGWAER